MEQYTVQCQKCEYKEQGVFYYFGLAQTIAENHAHKKGHKTAILYKSGGSAIMYPKEAREQKSVRKGVLERVKRWILSVANRFSHI